MLTVLDDLVIH